MLLPNTKQIPFIAIDKRDLYLYWMLLEPFAPIPCMFFDYSAAGASSSATAGAAS